MLAQVRIALVAGGAGTPVGHLPLVAAGAVTVHSTRIHLVKEALVEDLEVVAEAEGPEAVVDPQPRPQTKLLLDTAVEPARA